MAASVDLLPPGFYTGGVLFIRHILYSVLASVLAGTP